MSDEDEILMAEIRRIAAEQKAFYEELKGENARAAVILAVSSLEDELERVLRSMFPDDLSDKLWKEIAGPGLKPFGSLKARADNGNPPPEFVFSPTHVTVIVRPAT